MSRPCRFIEAVDTGSPRPRLGVGRLCRSPRQTGHSREDHPEWSGRVHEIGRNIMGASMTLSVSTSPFHRLTTTRTISEQKQSRRRAVASIDHLAGALMSADLAALRWDLSAIAAVLPG